MPPIEDQKPFGAAGNCTSLVEALDVIRSNPGASSLRKSAAAFGMALSASSAVGDSEYFEDTLNVLNHLVRAKAEIDIAAWHTKEIAETTSAILSAAQVFVDEQTIPCTEWPSPREVSSVVFKAARARATA